MKFYYAFIIYSVYYEESMVDSFIASIVHTPTNLSLLIAWLAGMVEGRSRKTYLESQQFFYVGFVA